ncbi:MAG: type IV toxin-antitoxin system AbiEi family antitoxin domain-containing protein [Pseudonocardiaceae bacterium]
MGLRADRLSALPVTFTTGRAERAGLWRRDLYLLRDAGVVSEISRGVYRKVDAPETAHLDLLAVAHRAPLAVVCLISALAVHELTDEVPAVVQVAVPRGTHRPRITYPPTEVSEFDARTFELGLQEREVAPGERVRIYEAARSVVDVMRLRHRIGAPVALRALRRWVERRTRDPAELLYYAGALDVEGPVRQAVEAVLS